MFEASPVVAFDVAWVPAAEACRTMLQMASHISLASLRRQGAREVSLRKCGGNPDPGTDAAEGISVGVKRRKSQTKSSRNPRRNTLRGSSSTSSSDWRGPYTIPRGPLFAYISCPHYLSEVLIYFSLLLSAPDGPT